MHIGSPWITIIYSAITQITPKVVLKKMVIPLGPCSYSCCSAPMVKKSKFGHLKIHQHFTTAGADELTPSVLLAALCSAGHASQPTTPAALHLLACCPVLMTFTIIFWPLLLRRTWPGLPWGSSSLHPPLVQIACGLVTMFGRGVHERRLSYVGVKAFQTIPNLDK